MSGAGWTRSHVLAAAIVVGAAGVLWLPRGSGPIDLRWDGAVYYILGTSLAEGRGYKLLNEPGEIDAVQYPPLLPAIVAMHQLAAGTRDPWVVGRWLRWSSCAVFLLFALASFAFLRPYVPAAQAAMGALLSVCCLHAWFLSDALFPEVWFTLATLLFLIAARPEKPAGAALAWVWAVLGYALRTVGITAFAAWVLDSVLRLRVRQAAGRALLAAVPVILWQGYVASVERSDGYQRPAYAYQRAPYLFYNVPYARNVALRDPFTPEKGDVILVRRIVRNALDLPVHLGEALSISRGYAEMGLHAAFGDGPILRPLIAWGVYLSLACFGTVLVAGGLAVQMFRGRLLVPLYVLVYLAALCLTPFPGQYLRYLMPLTPLLALLALTFLNAIGASRVGPSLGRSLPYVILGPALLLQVAVTWYVFTHEYQRASYVSQRGERIEYRMFYYGERQEAFDRAVDYLQRSAAAHDVVAAGTPHWIHLRTGLKTVMPPFEAEPARAQALLDTVPVRYLVIGSDVVATERYTAPVVSAYADRWEEVYADRRRHWIVYRRTGAGAGPPDVAAQ